MNNQGRGQQRQLWQRRAAAGDSQKPKNKKNLQNSKQAPRRRHCCSSSSSLVFAKPAAARQLVDHADGLLQQRDSCGCDGGSSGLNLEPHTPGRAATSQPSSCAVAAQHETTVANASRQHAQGTRDWMSRRPATRFLFCGRLGSRPAFAQWQILLMCLHTYTACKTWNTTPAGCAGRSMPVCRRAAPICGSSWKVGPQIGISGVEQILRCHEPWQTGVH